MFAPDRTIPLSPSARRRSAGYNLVETMIATVLLGAVALSIMTLLTMGRRNVYSGRQMTHALAFGNQVLEDISNMTLDQVYQGFVITDASKLATYTIDGIEYKDALFRTTDASVVPGYSEATLEAPSPGNFLTTWKTQMGADKKLSQGSVTLILSPREPTAVLAATGKPAPMILQMRVLVRWNEEKRARHVTLDSVKAKF